MFNHPYFGISLTVGAYWIGLKIQSKTKKVYFNPLLIAMLLCISILKVSRISYDTYMIGAQYISIWMTPATVALMTLVYRNRVLLKKNLVPVLAGILAGACASLSTVWLLCRLFRLDRTVTLSLLPKSLTTAIGVVLAEEYSGEPSVTVLAIIVSGLIGAVMAPAVLRWIRVRRPLAKGVGIGTASHAIGTAKALELGEIEGAMSGLSIALMGLMSIPLMACFVYWLS